MAIPEVPLPPYPNSRGHNVALRLDVKRKQYAAAVNTLRKELAAVEDAFTGSFAQLDERQATRDRLATLSAVNRQRARRG